MDEKKLNKKCCFVCHKEVEPENYAVHYAFGAIICSPVCYAIIEEATQKALMEEIQKNMVSSESYCGNPGFIIEEKDGKEINAKKS